MKKLNFMLAIIIMLSFTLISCTPQTDDKKPVTKEANVISFWSAPATEKILKDYNKYDNIKTDAEIDMLVAKGEYESSQIIMTANDYIEAYDVKVSDLTGASGTYSKDNITVYNQKYINVSTIFDGNGAPTGMYPDCLLPFDAAKKYKENKITKGDNQGLYITFNTGANQAPGVYNGNLQIEYYGNVKSVPITLEVLDLTVSQEVRSKSIFLNQWNSYSGDLSSTQAMLNSYTDKLIEYRLAPDILVVDTNHSDEDIEYYTELAYDYLKDPRCSNITIPYATTFIENQQCIDPVIFKKYVWSFIDKSIENNFDMLKKSICYFGIIDEPEQNGLFDRVKVVTKVFDQLKVDLAAEIEEKIAPSTLRAELLESLSNLRNVVTCSYASDYAQYVDTFCPQIQHYDSEGLRENYAFQEEKWWYTCISPRTPYPTYHTEDSLLSARAMGWMQADYDVVGNLFWATNIYAEYNGKQYVNIEDYYEGNAKRFPNVNGDGYLFYPGKKYGMDKPLGSLRLEAIRDGLEEYELILDMKNNYNKIIKDNSLSYTFDKFMDSISQPIYSGTSVSADSTRFEASRKTLLEYAYLLNSDSNLALLDFSDDGYGNITNKFYVASGYVMKQNGAPLTDYIDVKNGRVYTHVSKLSADSNILNLTIEGEKTFKFSQNLGGKVEVIKAEDFAGGILKEDVTPTAKQIVAGTIDSTLTGNMQEITLPSAPQNTYQSFALQNAKVSGIDEKSSKMVVHIYYNNAEANNLNFTISAKFENSARYSDLITVKLKQGMNTIEIPLGHINFKSRGEIEKLIAYVGVKKDAKVQNTLYLYDIVVYNK